MTDEEWRQTDEGKASIERATKPIAITPPEESQETKDWRETDEGKASTLRANQPMPFPFIPANKLLEGIRQIQRTQEASDSKHVARGPEKAQPKKQPSDELIRVFDDSGTTIGRRKFFNAARDAVIGLRKKQGKNVSVQEFQGQGTIINVDRKPGTSSVVGACCIDGVCSQLTEAACTDAGGTYRGDGTPCTPDPCMIPCGGGCTSFPLTATFTFTCDGGGGTCTCTGAMSFFSSLNCDYRGGCNTPDCSDMPVNIDIRNISGTWQIRILLDTTGTGICPTHSDSFCTGWDGVACNYIDLTTNHSPVGTWEIDLVDEGFSGTCHVHLIIGDCCDGSTVVNATLTATNQVGTCPANIDFTTTTMGSVSGEYVFDSESSLGTAHFCTFSSGTMEITNGNLHLVCETDSSEGDTTFFVSLRLVVVTLAGDIEGTMYNVGDWVLLVGSIYEIVSPPGVCSFCISSHASTWLVFPTITNTTTITDGGVSVDLSLTFTF